MSGASTLPERAIQMGLVAPAVVKRFSRRVFRRARNLGAWEHIWVEELEQGGYLTPYQARALLAAISPRAADRLPRLRPSCEVPQPERGNEVVCGDEYRQRLPGQAYGPAWPLTIGPYVVLDHLGGSDLGTTYLCRHRRTGQPTIVKLLAATWREPNGATDRLADVCRAWAALRPGNGVSGQRLEWSAETAPLLVSAATGARSLAATLPPGARFRTSAALAIWRQMVTTLAAADTGGLVHGNLRPSNILLGHAGSVILTDCGLRCALDGAGLYRRCELPPARYDYVAPEVSLDQAVPSASSDIYSLGSLLFHMLTGSPPFAGGDVEAKCAAMRAGKPIDPVRLGVAFSAELRALIAATLEPDPARRVSSYTELLSLIPPLASRRRSAVCSEVRWPAGVVGEAAAGRPRPAANRRHWLTAALSASALAAVLWSLLLWQRHPWPLAGAKPDRSEPKAAPVQPPRRHRRPATDPTAVTTIWRASDSLRQRYESIPAGGTILLKSSGPFRLDTLTITKPVTIRGDPQVRPLFIGTPGSSLRITASGVRLENVHFLRVLGSVSHGGPAAGTGHHATAFIELTGPDLQLTDCSFTGPPDVSSVGPALHWQVDQVRGPAKRPSLLVARNLLMRNVAAGLAVQVPGSARVELHNCLHLGPGPLVESRSVRSGSGGGLDVLLEAVTVYGAGTVRHRFPEPLAGAQALHVEARNCLLVPAAAGQPVLAVDYATSTPSLMPLVLWSGSDTVCPSDAQYLQVNRGPKQGRWRAVGIAAWQAYWGPHGHGVTGLPIPFASRQPGDVAHLKLPRGPGAVAVGANPSLLHLPPRLAAGQLAALLERLSN